eukprot:200642-Pyramimonas_sp.AAC.2
MKVRNTHTAAGPKAPAAVGWGRLTSHPPLGEGLGTFLHYSWLGVPWIASGRGGGKPRWNTAP